MEIQLPKKTVHKVTDLFVWRIMFWFGLLVILTFSVNLVRDYFNIGFDDTDGPTARSGMRVLIDNHTGCQYLNTPSGGLTPRLNQDGAIICE